jgi:hypothetical protein
MHMILFTTPNPLSSMTNACLSSVLNGQFVYNSLLRFFPLLLHHTSSFESSPLIFSCACLQFSRDWFFERFQLVIDDVLTEMEKTLRAKLKWTLQGRVSDGVVSGAGRNQANMTQLKELLTRGLQVPIPHSLHPHAHVS